MYFLYSKKLRAVIIGLINPPLIQMSVLLLPVYLLLSVRLCSQKRTDCAAKCSVGYKCLSVAFSSALVCFFCQVCIILHQRYPLSKNKNTVYGSPTQLPLINGKQQSLDYFSWNCVFMLAIMCSKETTPTELMELVYMEYSLQCLLNDHMPAMKKSHYTSSTRNIHRA